MGEDDGLVGIHEERYLGPGNRGSKELDYPPYLPSNSLANGLYWEEMQKLYLAAGWTWSRSPAIRAYHPYLSCLTGRLPYLEPSMIHIFANSSPKLTAQQIALLDIQFAYKPKE